MNEVKVSSKFQFVIPREIRAETGIKIGERMVVLAKDGIISLIPRHVLKKMRGVLKGMKIEPYREAEDR